jgi:hypothetical protein
MKMEKSWRNQAMERTFGMFPEQIGAKLLIVIFQLPIYKFTNLPTVKGEIK